MRGSFNNFQVKDFVYLYLLLKYIYIIKNDFHNWLFGEDFFILLFFFFEVKKETETGIYVYESLKILTSGVIYFAVCSVSQDIRDSKFVDKELGVHIILCFEWCCIFVSFSWSNKLFYYPARVRYLHPLLKFFLGYHINYFIPKPESDICIQFTIFFQWQMQKFFC